MNTKIAIILFGLAVAASAADYGKLRMRQNVAPPKTYAQQPAVLDEEVMEEQVYAAPVKPIVKGPIRVVQEPAASYGSNGGNGGGYSRVASKDRYEESEAAAEEQTRNANANYSFGSAIDDGIMDHSHVRQETRDGLKVEGSFAYSDGYFKRTTHYEADENGYRVVSETVEPLNESGPKVDLVNGKAEIHTQISGVDTQYEVSAGEISNLKKLKD